MNPDEPASPPGGPPTGLAKRLAYPLVIAAIWAVYFSRALFFGQVFSYRDLFFFFEPIRRYTAGLLAAGHPPFLNAALNFGEPILANPNNAVFYPGNLLYFVLPFGVAWNWFLAGHVLFAALGVYWLARRLDCAREAALCGALVIGFCGPLVSTLNYSTLLVAASWLPWVAGLALMSWKRGGAWTAATAVALAMQVLGGEPSIVLVTAGLLACGYAVGMVRDRTNAWPALLRGLFIAVTAGLIAAIQIVPTLYWLPHSGRSAGLPFRESAAFRSLHPARLAELLVPHIYGNPVARLASDFWGSGLSDSGLPYILKLYAGWLPLLLLPLALRRSIGRWAAFVFAACIALAFGHRLPGYHFLYTVFAPLRVIRYPEKFTIVAAFALAMTTAIALPRDCAAPTTWAKFRARAVLLTTTGVLLALLPVLLYALPHATLTVVQRVAQWRGVEQAAVVGVVSCFLLVLGTIPRFRRLAAGLIPVVLVLDLTSVTWDVAATRPPNAAPALLGKLSNASTTPILHLGEQQSDAYFAAERDPVLSMHDALHPFTGLSSGVIYGAVDDIDRLGWKIAEQRRAILLKTIASSLDASSALHACGIGRVVSLAPLTLAGLHEESELTFPDGPTVRVYATDAAPIPLVHFESGDGSLHWTDEAPHRLSISLETKTESTIVVTRNAVDGWKATDGGRPVTLSSSPEGFLRLALPAGRHELLLSYTPPGLFLGAMLSIVGLVAIFGWVFATQHRGPVSKLDALDRTM